MRKNRQRLTKLTLLVLFLAFLLIFKDQLTKFLPKKSNMVFPNFNKTQIKELTLVNPSGTIIVFKKNNHWYLKKNNQEFKANEEIVNNIINDLSHLKKEDLVATNKNRFRDLGIDKSKISFNLANQHHNLYIGNNYSLNKSYFKVDNENEVFVGEGFDNFLNTSDFRDLKVYLVNNENDVASLQIEFDNEKLSIEKKNNDWIINNKAAAKDKVDFFINDLKTLKADDILDKNNNLSILQPDLVISVKENSKLRQAQFFNQDQDNYLLKISNSDLTYQVSASVFSSLKKEEKDFLE